MKTKKPIIDYKTASKILRDYEGWKVLKETIIVYFKEEYNWGYIYGFKKSEKEFFIISHTEAKPIYLVKNKKDYPTHSKYHYEINAYKDKDNHGICHYTKEPILITTIETDKKIVYSNGEVCLEEDLLEEIGLSHPTITFSIHSMKKENNDSTNYYRLQNSFQNFKRLCRLESP